MTYEQLTVDGRSVPYPLPKPRHLTARQRDMLVILTASDVPMTTREVGRLYADPSGALRRLERMGLVERVSRGKWIA
jgi:hypothetical protein